MTTRAGPATLAARMLDVGSVVAGRYRVEGELGRGGMGRVLLARHLVLGERVALKIVATNEEHDDAPRVRLLREARAAARLRSDYVVRVLDVFTVSRDDDRRGGDVGALCLVLEHVDGPTLAHEIAQRAPLPVGEATTLVLQIAVGLAEAHAHGIVHRDLKPANVLLATLPDGRRRPRIIDFGIAKAPVAASEGATLTGEGALLGSPVYMAPEQITDPHGVDERADLWSLGVVLYELLTRGLPFEGLTTAGLLARIEHDRPRPPNELRPGLPEALVTHLLRCLEKDPAARFADVATLARALAPFAPDGAALAEEITRTRARRPTAEPVDASPAPVAVGSLTATDEPPSSEPPDEAREDDGDGDGETDRRSAPEDASATARRGLLAPIVATALGLGALGAYVLVRLGPSPSPAVSLPTVPGVRASATPPIEDVPPVVATAAAVSREPSVPPMSVSAAGSASTRKPVPRQGKVADETPAPDIFDKLGSRK